MNNYNAGELLDLMRFDVEGILIDCKSMFGDKIPTCKSQSHRALRAIEQIKARLDAPHETMKFQFRLRQQLWRLEKFLAVHETVNILERKERDPNGLDIFGNFTTNHQVKPKDK